MSGPAPRTDAPQPPAPPTRPTANSKSTTRTLVQWLRKTAADKPPDHAQPRKFVRSDGRSRGGRGGRTGCPRTRGTMRGRLHLRSEHAPWCAGPWPAHRVGTPDVPVVVERRYPPCVPATRTAQWPPTSSRRFASMRPSAVGMGPAVVAVVHLVPTNRPLMDRFEAAVSAPTSCRTWPHASSGRVGLFSHTSQPPVTGTWPSTCRSRAGTRSGWRTPDVVRVAHELLDHRLAGIVVRVRTLPATTSWIGRRSSNNSGPPSRFGSRQHQGEPFVGRHPAGEPDRQHIRVEHRVGPVQFPAADMPRRNHDARTRRPHLLHQPGPAGRQRNSHKLPVRTRRSGPMPWHQGRSPAVSSASGAVPRRPPCTPLVIEPIGTLGDVEPWPQRAETIARLILAVQPGHPVGALGQPQSHMPPCLNTPGSSSAPSARIRAHVQAGQQVVVLEIAAHQVDRESVDAGGHPGVCVVKDRGRRGRRPSAWSKSRPSAASSRMRSQAEETRAWPSLVWKTSGRGWPVRRHHARTARTRRRCRSGSPAGCGVPGRRP